MNRKYIRKITTGFFIFIFLMNSVPLSVWAMVSEGVVDDKNVEKENVVVDEKLELSDEKIPEVDEKDKNEEKSVEKDIAEEIKDPKDSDGGEKVVEEDVVEDFNESVKKDSDETEKDTEEQFSEEIEEIEEIEKTEETEKTEEAVADVDKNEEEVIELDEDNTELETVTEDIEKVELPLESEKEELIETTVDTVKELNEVKKSETSEDSKEEKTHNKVDYEVEYSDNEDGSVSFEIDNKQIEEKGKVSFEYKDTGFEVVFSEIEENGILTIKEIKLSKKEVKKLNAVSDVAYDVTLVDENGDEIENGTFKYDLVFPVENAEDKKANVKYADNLSDLVEGKDVNNTDEDKTEVKDDKIVVEDLDHFTIFVATTPDPDINSVLLINEFLVDPSGADKEWVEFYNNTDLMLDVSDWYLLDSTGTKRFITSLGTINARDFAVLETGEGWLNNKGSAGWETESISIFDDKDILVDKVYFNDTIGSEIDNYPLEDQSVGRIEDGGNDWVLFDVDETTKGKGNVPTGKIIFTSYVCSDSFAAGITDSSTKNNFKPDVNGNVSGDLRSECSLVGGYNIGHGDDATSLPIPETGVSVGKIDGSGVLEVEVEARNDKYVFGQLDKNDKWIGYEDAKVYSDEVLGFACTSSPSGGLRDNNAEAFVVKAGETTYCNLYVADVILPVPEQTGYNQDDGDDYAIPIHPNEISCSNEATNINGVSVHWTDVVTGNVNESVLKYQRQYSTNGVSWNGSEIYTNPYTNYRSFGGGAGNEGIYYSRVRTFIDENNDGQYNVGEKFSEWSNVCDITYDATAPNVWVDGLRNIDDNTPQLTGTVNDPDAVIVVSVDGISYPAVNNGDNTWTLADNTIFPALNDGIYDVVVSATDLAGNVRYDESISELSIDTTPLTITLENPNDGDVVNGEIDLKALCSEECDYVKFWWRKDDQLYSNVSPDRRYHYMYDDGTEFEWTLNSLNAERWDEDLNYVMSDGKYYLYVEGEDRFGNKAKSEEVFVIVDNTDPVITVNKSGLINDNSPELSGKVDDMTATIVVTVGGNDYVATNNGDGTWTLADNNISPALSDGVYDVIAVATDSVGNVGIDKTVDELTIDTTAPILKEINPVDSLINNNAPEYIFSSDEEGIIAYGGSCSSLVSEAIDGENTINFEELADGVYSDCTITVTDKAGNTSDILNVSEFIIDTEKPTASQLSDKIFNEGNNTPLVTVAGNDNLEVETFCFSVIDQNGDQFLTETCDSSGSGVKYGWNTFLGLPTIFDTSMIPEGAYTINYYIKDTAGNVSDNYSVVYTLNNVAPSVEFSVSDDDIDEDDKGHFSGSFTDPSTKDAGDNVFDDSEWYATINYGEGEDVYLGTFSNESSISIPKHKYKHDGDFVAKLTVCESDTNLSSEKKCTSKEVSIEVDDKKDDKKDDNKDENDEIVIPVNTYNNFIPSYNDSISSIVDQNDEEVQEVIIEEVEKSKPVVKVEEKKPEVKGIVAGEQTCQNKWPIWAWILLLFAFLGITSLIGYGTKTKDENASSIFWQVALMIAALLIWYFFDVCRVFIWFPILSVVGGAVIATVFYKEEEVSQK